MNIYCLYKKCCLLSPFVEVALRKLYWHNIKILDKYGRKYLNSSTANINNEFVNFDRIVDFLKSVGVDKGSLVIMHTSYAALEPTGLDENQILDALFSLIGDNGTLAMPVIRKFEGEPKVKDILTSNLLNVVTKYDVQKTKIISGLLPYVLMNKKNAKTSLFPLNPLTAVGPLAYNMTMHNLDGDYPSPHGPNSAWKFCYDHDAYVVGLGVDLEHYNTSIHIAEEAFNDWKWSDEEWYRKRLFDIIDEKGNVIRKVVKERKPKWGTMHFAELNLYRDLIKNGIVQRKKLGNIVVCVEKQRELIDYLRSKNKNGYPYF